MKIDCLRFYVEDAEQWRDWFVRVLQFRAVAGGDDGQTHTEIVSSGNIALALCSPRSPESPVAAYLRSHPAGIADVSLLVPDLEAALQRASALPETQLLQPIQGRQFPRGEMRWCQIIGAAAVAHTLVERRGLTPILPADWAVVPAFSPENATLFAAIDHLTINVAVGALAKTASWYESALGFDRQQTFSIQTEQSGLFSQVLVHPASGVQIPVNEPTSANSQIQEFLDFNGGAGVQHVALQSNNIFDTVCQLRAAGLPFLNVPQSYYARLQHQHPQLVLSPQEWAALARSQILIDPQTSDGESKPLLLQIFTQPIFEQPTFFWEFIERRDRARGFGEGNFRALFEAIEKEQARRGKLGEIIRNS